MLMSMANISVQTNISVRIKTAPWRSGSTLIATKTSFKKELVDDIWVVNTRYERKMQLMLTSMAYFSVQTNIVDLNQTALRRAV